MADGSPITVSKGIYKLQLSLLDGISNEEQLFAAGALLSCADYEDIVTERSITSRCGYPSCSRSLQLEDGQKGRYHISLKEHKVYDLEEARKFCSSDCLIKSRAFAASLPSERRSDLDWEYLDNILRAFGELCMVDKGTRGKTGDLGAAEMRIVEKMDVSGEISLDDWIGPAGSIEGYVPREHYDTIRSSEIDTRLIHSDKNANKGKECNNVDFVSSITLDNKGEIIESGRGANVTFTSAIIVPGKSSASVKSNHRQKIDHASREKKLTEISSRKQGSEEESGKIFACDTSQTKKVSQAKISNNQLRRVVNLGQRELHASEGTSGAKEMVTIDKSQLKLFSSTAGSETELIPDEVAESSRIETNCFVEPPDIGKSSKPTEELVEAKGVHLKSSLKYSATKNLGRGVTWADEKRSDDVGELALCSYHEIEDKLVRAGNLGSSIGGDDDNSLRIESAEACALSLTQAADNVASGELQALEAVSSAGITILSSGHDANGANLSESLDIIESDILAGKCPQKTVLLDTDAFDCDDFWHDIPPPEGFSLTLSPFATMWMTLFGWISSASLAYIYGQSESMEDDFTCVKGREYPRKVVLSDGKSLEIQQALEGCMARALPELISGLRIRTPLSDIEKAIALLLGTMSFCDALPPFRMRQWQVIVILFLDALSVQRIPSLSEPMANSRMQIRRIFDGAKVSTDEYEIMKDLFLPLGRSLEFSSQCGA